MKKGTNKLKKEIDKNSISRVGKNVSKKESDEQIKFVISTHISSIKIWSSKKYIFL